MFIRKFNRLFTFGCSFTQYFWPLWPEILSYELNVPLYNFGRCGAGNQYIFNMLMQADNVYKFNNDDLIIVSWTNVCREDRFKKHTWHTPGNIFSQSIYSKNFVEEWGDPIGYCLRDFATIKSTTSFLKNKQCQYSMLSMCNLLDIVDQWDTNKKFPDLIDQISNLYYDTLSEINKSFYEILWNNDLSVKYDLDSKIHRKFVDGHPLLIECLKYLEIIYEYKFKADTIDRVNIIQKEFEQFIVNIYNNPNANKVAHCRSKFIHHDFNKNGIIDNRIIL